MYRYEIKLDNETSGFLHQVPGYCIGLGIYEAALDHEQGYCAFRDSKGDLYFERYEHYGQVGRGSGSAIGGTGKYDGITGSHEYRFEAIDPDATQFVSKAQRSGVTGYFGRDLAEQLSLASQRSANGHSNGFHSSMGWASRSAIT